MFHYLKDDPNDTYVTRKKIIEIVEPGKRKEEIKELMTSITKKKNIDIEDFVKIIQKIIDFYIVNYQ